MKIDGSICEADTGRPCASTAPYVSMRQRSSGERHGANRCGQTNRMASQGTLSHLSIGDD